MSGWGLTSRPAHASGTSGPSFAGNPACSCFSATQAKFDFRNPAQFVAMLSRHLVFERNSVDRQYKLEQTGEEVSFLPKINENRTLQKRGKRLLLCSSTEQWDYGIV